MKRIFRNNRLVAIAFLTLFTGAAFGSVTPGSNFSGKQVELNFVGNIYNQSVFQLKVNGLHDDEFTLSIRDRFGNPVYKENISAGNFSKKFLFDTDELSDEALLLEVYNRTKKQTVLYEISLTADTRCNASIKEFNK